MPPVRAPVDEPGIVAIEWPKSEIAPEYLRPEAHAVLITAAQNEARKLGLIVGRGSCIVRSVGEHGERLRFVWGTAET